MTPGRHSTVFIYELHSWTKLQKSGDPIHQALVERIAALSTDEQPFAETVFVLRAIGHAPTIPGRGEKVKHLTYYKVFLNDTRSLYGKEIFERGKAEVIVIGLGLNQIQRHELIDFVNSANAQDKARLSIT